MCLRSHRLLAFSVSALLLTLIAGVATQQAPPGQPVGDGLLRSELALSGRVAILTYSPTLQASDPAHKGLLSATPGSANSRVLLGQLETTGSLRVGTVVLERQGQGQAARQTESQAAIGSVTGTKYDLWLEGTSDGWRIQATDAAKAVVGEFPLSRQAGDVASPNLVAALLPEDGTTGRLVIRWGEYKATADVQYTNPARRRVEETSPNTVTRYRHDEDTSVLTRARMLAQRNETAFVLAKGPRLSVSFQRTFGKGERPTNNNAQGRGLSADGPDFANLLKTPDGQVVTLSESSVPRLRTEAPLQFGKVLLATGNLVPGSPGAYGIWLKRVGSGWRLVMNNQPDAWGSQHDPKFDAAEVDLTHTDGHAASRPFAVGIEPTAADRGRLVIVWGPHEWSADFVVPG